MTEEWEKGEFFCFGGSQSARHYGRTATQEKPPWTTSATATGMATPVASIHGPGAVRMLMTRHPSLLR